MAVRGGSPLPSHWASLSPGHALPSTLFPLPRPPLNESPRAPTGSPAPLALPIRVCGCFADAGQALRTFFVDFRSVTRNDFRRRGSKRAPNNAGRCQLFKNCGKLFCTCGLPADEGTVLRLIIEALKCLLLVPYLVMSNSINRQICGIE